MAALHEAIIDALASLRRASRLDRGAARGARTAATGGRRVRTAALRQAAADGAARIGSPETLAALEEAPRSGSRGVRKRRGASWRSGREGAAR